MRHRCVVLLLAVAAIAACSGSDSADDPAGPGDVTTIADAATNTSEPEVAAADAEADSNAEPDDDVGQEWTVTVDVTGRASDSSGFSGNASWTFDPSADTGDGAFGQFASCSGLRTYVTGYSVSLFEIGTFDVVTVATSDPATTPGIHDAQIQLQRRDGELVIASGTLTLFDGLQSGEFLTVEADDTRIEGTFECSGSAPPSALAVGDDDDGVLESVEVSALLRNGDAQRVVGLAADGNADVECPAASGEPSGEILLGVSGDARLGAITEFELAENPAIVRMTVNGVGYDFDDVTISVEQDGAAGTFSASSPDGVSVDGAFRCS